MVSNSIDSHSLHMVIILFFEFFSKAFRPQNLKKTPNLITF